MSETICKTVSQYSGAPISDTDMGKLREIAEDYRRVKNYVYARYGGTGSLSKLYPGYTIQNEMTDTGLRAELEMPSVYFYLAVFDALGDIKSQWTRTKSKVLRLISLNETLAPEEKHYLRFLMRSANAFEAVLNQKRVQLPPDMQKRYEELAGQTDTEKLHRYLCRQVRKYHVRRQHADTASGFSITERAYRYGDHGIYIATKERRKRIFVPLTDNNRYRSQLYIKLYPEEAKVEIRVPLHLSARRHEDYVNKVGLSMGMLTMLTTDQGRSYGETFGTYQTEYARWVRSQTISYNRNRRDNPGRKKYYAKKRRYVERMHSYINQELNRFFRTEKPRTVYIVKLPRPQAVGNNGRINNSVALWHRGYIRKRLMQKCREQSVEFIEVLGKDISNECSRCGGAGDKRDGIFTCKQCGFAVEDKTNTARNVLRRGSMGIIVR